MMNFIHKSICTHEQSKSSYCSRHGYDFISLKWNGLIDLMVNNMFKDDFCEI